MDRLKNDSEIREMRSKSNRTGKAALRRSWEKVQRGRRRQRQRSRRIKMSPCGQGIPKVTSCTALVGIRAYDEWVAKTPFTVFYIDGVSRKPVLGIRNLTQAAPD